MLVAGIACYGVLILADTGEGARRALGVPAAALWGIGSLGVLVLGIALAIHVDAYQVWDGWIIVAIVLWLIAGAASGPLARSVREARGDAVPDARARLLLAVMAGATALLLIDMIFKPG